MNSELLQRYLNGLATDAERQACESFLADPQAIVDWQDSPATDSLLETLRLRSTGDTHTMSAAVPDSARLESLVHKIEQMVPRHAIGRDELERILDPPQSPDELGRLGRYRVLEFIASGGMGLVFRAEEPDLERSVCLKVMNPLLASRSDAKRRFAREARAASRLQHERIVTVLEVGEHRDLPYIAMELLEGESLRQRLQRDQTLSVVETQRIALQIAEGLRYAHSRGYLHRDIKPDNIWLTPDGNVKLLDFGLARAVDESIDLTHSGAVVGTPRYMSPEQVQSKPLTETSDLFSLGIVMYEMLVGQSPFDRTNVFSTMMSVANDPVEPAWNVANERVPESFRELVHRLLAKDPTARPGSADDVIAELTAPPSLPLKPLVAASAWGRWSYAAGGLLAAFGLWAVATLVLQATDKGVLVIEADPEVELRLSDEVITVTDPKTEKIYTVRIGSQPLPSGVYQLEMSDDSGELTFSSQVITLRRRAEVLVRITLRPPEATVAANTDSQAGTSDPLAANEVETALSQFDLATLPALDAAATRRALGLEARKRLSPFATVTDPNERAGFASWSLEPIASGDPHEIARLSPNGERIARGGSGGYVRIHNTQFALTHLLPTTDLVVDLAWSPQPNVLVVVCQGDFSREAIIWRLNESTAEILQRIPLEGSKAVWSCRGDRIAFGTESGVLFYDVAKSQAYAINRGIVSGNDTTVKGEITARAWSADDQLIAVTEGDAVKVWSLTEGSIVHIFPLSSRPRWLATGHHLALERHAGAQVIVEVWDLDTLGRLEARSVEPDWISNSLVLGSELNVLAAITSDGKLAVVGEQMQELNLVTPDDVALGHPVPNDNVLNNLSWLELSADGRRMLVRLFRQYALFEVDNSATPQRVSGWHDPTPKWLPMMAGQESTDHLLSTYLTFRRSEDEEVLRVGRLDLESLHSSSFEIDQSSSESDRGSNRKTKIHAVLPDASNTHIAIAEKVAQTLEIRELASGEIVFQDVWGFGGLQEMQWSPDGRFLVLSVVLPERGRTASASFYIVDIAGHSMIRLNPVGERDANLCLPQGVPLSRIVDNQLLVVLELKSNDATGRSRANRFLVESYDLATGQQVKSLELGLFESLLRFDMAGDNMVFLARAPLKNLEEYVSNREGDVFFRRWGTPENEDQHSLTTTQRTIELRLSSAGRFLYMIAEGIRQPPGLSVFPIEAIARGGAVADAADARFPGSLSWQRPQDKSLLPVWHPDRPQLALNQLGRVVLYDAETQRVHQTELVFDEDLRITPASFGWVVREPSRLAAFDFEANYLGCWLDTELPEPHRWIVDPNRWIAKGGSTQGHDRADQFRFVGVRGNQVVTSSWKDIDLNIAPTIWPWSSD